MRTIAQTELDTLARVANVMPVYRRHVDEGSMPKEPSLWKKGCFGCSHSQGKLSDQGYYTTVWFYPSKTASVKGVTSNSPFVSFVINRNDTYFKNYTQQMGWHHWLYGIAGPYSNIYEPAKDILSLTTFGNNTPGKKPSTFYARISYNSLTNTFTHKHTTYDLLDVLPTKTPYVFVAAATFYGSYGVYADPRLNVQFDQPGPEHIRTHSITKFQAVTGTTANSNKILKLEAIKGSKPQNTTAPKSAKFTQLKPNDIPPHIWQEVQNFASDYAGPSV